jgi:hypothetical protein
VGLRAACTGHAVPSTWPVCRGDGPAHPGRCRVRKSWLGKAAAQATPKRSSRCRSS